MLYRKALKHKRAIFILTKHCKPPDDIEIGAGYVAAH